VSIRHVCERAVSFGEPLPTTDVPDHRSTPSVPLGTGIYTRTEAARLLRMTPERLRRWVGGYTYWLREASGDGRSKRRRPAVVHIELPVIGNTVELSFLELMELRVVKALIDRGVTLQHVRQAAQLASERFDTRHPMASQRVFTDGRHIFSAVTEDVDAPNVVKWTAGDIDQVVAGPVFDQFLSEIEFDSATALASRWWPLGRNVPIILDPAISFGAPVIAGTAIRTASFIRLVRGSTTRDAAIAYEVDVVQAEAAVEFEEALAAA
jgi:uncharacterized protein (DUF433 family)